MCLIIGLIPILSQHFLSCASTQVPTDNFKFSTLFPPFPFPIISLIGLAMMFLSLIIEDSPWLGSLSLTLTFFPSSSINHERFPARDWFLCKGRVFMPVKVFPAKDGFAYMVMFLARKGNVSFFPRWNINLFREFFKICSPESEIVIFGKNSQKHNGRQKTKFV